MKKFQRLLALAICMLLSLTSTLPALAEEWPATEQSAAPAAASAPAVEPEPVQQEPAAEPIPNPGVEAQLTPEEGAEGNLVQAEETPVEEPPVEGESASAEEPPMEGESASADAPVEGAIPAEGSTDELQAEVLLEELPAEAVPAIDTTQSAAHSPDFTCGYAQLLGSADGYPDAGASEAGMTVSGGIVYASARGNDRMLANFAGGEQAIGTWISVDLLRPMAEEEIQAFLLAKADARVFFNDDPALPLAALDYALIPPPTPDMVLEADSLTLGAGEKRAIPVRFSDGQAHGVTYSSSKDRYAKVSGDGIVQALRAGKSVTIKVTSEFGQSATVKVNILRGPRSVSVSPAKADLCPGDALTATAKLNSKSASAICWSSSNPGIATVDEAGRIRAVAPGSVTIKGTAFNGKCGAMELTVHAVPETIAFDRAEVVLGAGDGTVLKTVAAPEDYGSRSYRSSDPSVAEVDASSGKVTAKAAGSAMITVETYNGKTAACTVTVKAAPSRITLSQTSIVLGVGEKVGLPEVQVGAPGEDCMGSYRINKLKSRYVTLTEDSIIGRRAGSVTITVSTYNGQSAELKVTVCKAPRWVKVTPSEATMGVGETLTLKSTLNRGAGGGVTYSSSNAEVASVQQDGSVRAIAPGIVTITAKTFNGRTGKCTIQVCGAPNGIALSATELAMGAGETATLKASLPEGSAGHYSFDSSNPAVATIDAADGRISALAAGTAILRASTYNGVSAACQLTVKAAPTGVAFQEKSLTLAAGDSYQLLEPVLQGDDPGSANLRYTSASARRVTVSASGLVTAKRSGKTTITVATYNGKKATIPVTVKAAPKSISFGQNSLRMCVGSEYTPAIKTGDTACSYNLSSSNPEVASISADGKTIVARGGGTAVITATSYNKKTAQLTLTVPSLPTSVALSPDRITLGQGDTIALKAVMPEGQDSALTYFSSNAACVSVDANGQITAVAPGEARISVKTINQLEGECAVTVLRAPTRVELSPAQAVRGIHERQLQLELRYGAEGEGGRRSFSSSNPAVASVNQSGLVTLNGAGETRITVETYNGLTASCNLTVGETPGRMYFEQAEYALALGDSVRLDAKFDKGCESHSIAIANGNIASARGDELTGLAVGSTEVLATSFSGLNASCMLNVVPAPTGIELNRTEMSITMGLSSENVLKARALPDGVGSCRFTSSDPAVARVDAVSGAITAVAPGECVITATTYNGFSATCALKVQGLLEGVKIGIDPGHQIKANRTQEAIAPGSRRTKDSVSSGTGGVGTRTPEHVVNLQIGLKLRDALEALGAEVYMTRTSADVNISNQQRAKMMNELGVDLVMRVHCNGGSSSKRGMSIYVRQTGACKAESAQAAQLIVNAMAKETGAKNLGVKYTDKFTGLNWSTVPSMLMEVGYLTNRAEDKLLNSPDYQDKLVKGMVNGVCGYMGRPTPDDIP